MSKNVDIFLGLTPLKKHINYCKYWIYINMKTLSFN